MSVPVAVMASGSGTNFQALLDAEGDGAAYQVALLVTDRECWAEARAEAHGKPSRRLSFKDRPRSEVASELLDSVKEAGAQAVLLAGFLRLVPEEVVQAFPRRILNVHPALLPAFGGQGMYGIRVHQAVLASGARVSGPTVHYVDEHYDEGAILAQWPVPVLPDDTPEGLAERVLEVEHCLFPAAADALARAIQAGSRPTFSWPGMSGHHSTWQSMRKAFEILP